jgi:transcription-repair coupling factor (superfamily II helicase)
MLQTFAKSARAGLHELVGVLEQQEGFQPALAALRAGHGAAVDGAWGSAASLTAGTLALTAPSTLLVVIAHPGDLDSWAEDLASFTRLRPVIFPAWETRAAELGADEVHGQRLRVLKLLQRAEPQRLILTTLQAVMQPVPTRQLLERSSRRLQGGQTLELEALVHWLVERGLQRRETVELPGEFSRRGGILDVYPPDADTPYRLEFFGDDLESIRTFAPDTQRSQGPVDELEITLTPDPRSTGLNGKPNPDLSTVFTNHLPRDAWVALVETGDLHEQGKHYLERTADLRGLYSVEAAFKHLLEHPNITISAMPASTIETTCHLRVESVERFSGDVNRVKEELDSVAPSDQVLIACHNEGEQKRLGEVLAQGQLAQTGRLSLLVGQVRAGFRLVDAGLVVLSDHELFQREALPARRTPTRRYESRAIDSFLDLADGDLVVHVGHGIGRFRGMQMLENKGNAEEHLCLEFAEGTRLYVPASKIDLVQKYVGGPKNEPELSKLGGLSWQKRKERVEQAVMDLAAEMIDLQAVRAAQPGISYPADTEWQAEFEASFPYQETPDQLTTLQELKADMERPRPMDRLICGDVGYGKTELAVRAAFKAIDSGKQVAVLVPTTVLAEQHYRTFSGRLAEYPFTVECLSRFRTGGEQREIVNRLGEGGLDVIIGTHRLLSADVQFKDLGLVVIDEEQRFGVEHKERLKKLRTTVDVLTLTATPIPRTLHLSLLGIRDISNLETAPRDRLAIETRITRFDPTLIRHAIVRELNRDGQVYFVHNRVYNIHEIAQQLQKIVPEARISVGHGQMSGDELEQTMLDFVQKKADILVATTIIESGLDIPNVNTIFIHEADNYGLADLHQLRGRVGRYKHRAYCYLLVDGQRTLSPSATKRLKAIEEFTELGAGFKIAMRDLEIRGAGNILGTQQSGHIAAVGYELYCQLLENSVRSLKNQPQRTSLEVNLDLPWRAFLPRDYVTGQRLKIEVYRRLSRIRKLERLEDFRQELVDRFGPLPEPAEWLLRSHELRLLAAKWHVGSIHLEKQLETLDVVLGYRTKKRIERLAALANKRLRVVDEVSAYYRLKPPEREPKGIYKVLKTLLQSSAESL